MRTADASILGLVSPPRKLHSILSIDYLFTLPITELSQPRRNSQDDQILPAPPLHSFGGESLLSGSPSSKPPPFSSLYFPSAHEVDRLKVAVTEAVNEHILATAPAPSFAEALAEDEEQQREAETKAALPRDTKGESSSRNLDDGEPPPPYTEGSSPLETFTYVMAAAGGASSIITQVQQTAGPPINTLGGMHARSRCGNEANVDQAMLVVTNTLPSI